MFVELTKEQEMVQKSGKQFAEKSLKDIAFDNDRSGRYPKEAIEEMGKLQLLGMRVPKEYGGQEMDFLSVALMAREVGKISASVAAVALTHIVQAADTIVKYGNDIQKKEYLTGLASGDKIGGYAYIEEGGSVGFGAEKVLAKQDGDGYLLSGKKTTVYNGGVADVYVVIAKEDAPDDSGELSAFLVDSKDVKVGETIDTMGLRTFPTCELIFENTKGTLLGEAGAGKRIMDDITARTNIISGAIATGIADVSLEESIEHCKTRVQFGAPIGKIQAVQFMLAEIQVAVKAMELAFVNAAKTKDADRDYKADAAFVKMQIIKEGYSATMNAVQIHGGIGYSREAKIERYFRDIRGISNLESIREYPEKIIAGDLLK